MKTLSTSKTPVTASSESRMLVGNAFRFAQGLLDNKALAADSYTFEVSSSYGTFEFEMQIGANVGSSAVVYDAINSFGYVNMLQKEFRALDPRSSFVLKVADSKLMLVFIGRLPKSAAAMKKVFK